MKIIFSTLLLIATISLHSFFAQAMESRKPILAVDVGVIAPNADRNEIVKNGLKKIPSIAPMVLCNHRMWPFYIKSAIKKAIAISEKTKGTTNIIYALNQWLKQENYGTLSPEEMAIVLSLGTVPLIKPDAISIIKKIKKSYTVIGFTSKDSVDFDLYKRIMKTEKNISLDDLFSGIVTGPTYNVAFNKDEEFYQAEPNLLIAKDPFDQPIFLQTVRTLGNRFSPEAPIYLVPEDNEQLEALRKNPITEHLNMQSMPLNEAVTLLQKSTD